MSGARLRRATPADLEAVVDVFLDSWASYRGILPPRLADRWTRAEAAEYWRTRLAEPAQTLILAERDGEAGGFVAFGPGVEARSGELSSLYVRAASGGEGIGRALLTHAEGEMRGRGWVVARLWVFAANRRARRFYERLGWRREGAEQVEESFGELELRMSKRLVPTTQMQREMEQQPAVLAAMLARRDEIQRGLREIVGEPHGVSLLARGSSDNAAIYARYLLELALRRPVSLVAPSLWTRYGLAERLPGQVVIAVSQSGETPEIVSTLRAMGEAGARSVAITNSGRSPLGAAADLVFELAAGAEQAVPATKTFSATLAAIAIIAEAVGTVPWGESDWSNLLSAQQALLADVEPARVAAESLVDSSAIVELGRGPLYAIALEGALKLAETTSLSASGFSSADFLHGPIARARPGVSVVAYATAGPVADDVHAAAEKSLGAGASLVVVGDDYRGRGLHLPVPGGLDEWLAPIAYAVRAQQLALFATEALGVDPDQPPNLSKVTATT